MWRAVAYCQLSCHKLQGILLFLAPSVCPDYLQVACTILSCKAALLSTTRSAGNVRAFMARGTFLKMLIPPPPQALNAFVLTIALV